MDINSSTTSTIQSLPSVFSSGLTFGTTNPNSTIHQPSSSVVSSGLNSGTTNSNSATHQPLSSAVPSGFPFGSTNSNSTAHQPSSSGGSSGLTFGTTNSNNSTIHQPFSSGGSSGVTFGTSNSNSAIHQPFSSGGSSGMTFGASNSNSASHQPLSLGGSSGVTFGTSNSNSAIHQPFSSVASSGSTFGTANCNSTTNQLFCSGGPPRFGFGFPNFNSANYFIPGSTIPEIAPHKPNAIQYSSGTILEEYSTVNTWTVKGLNRLCEGTSIESAPLTHQNSSKWCMVLTKQANELHLSFLLKKSGTNKQLRAKLKADEVLPGFGIRRVFPYKWYNLKEGERSEMWVIRRVDALGQDSSENEIVLQCEVCIQHITHDGMPAEDTADPHTSIARCLGEMLHKEVLTDFELHTEGRILKVHRGLLSVRSPYFAAKLQPHTKEATEGRMDVSDVKLEVLKQILLFIYTGVSPALKDMPWDLLVAADKFQLRQLKRQCEAHIADCLTVENATAAAVDASVHSCDLLWDRAVVFIKQNLYQVMRTRGWAEAAIAHPEAIQRIGEMME